MKVSRQGIDRKRGELKKSFELLSKSLLLTECSVSLLSNFSLHCAIAFSIQVVGISARWRWVATLSHVAFLAESSSIYFSESCQLFTYLKETEFWRLCILLLVNVSKLFL